MPKVSVVMASYNHEKYVAETIESVLSQTCQDFEFIITDDGSSDRTVEVIKKFADPRIKLFSFSKNQGACVAMNNCIKEAKGEYIAVINSDDAWMPEKLEKQVKFLEENSDIGAAFTHAQIIDDNGNDRGEGSDFYTQVFLQLNKTRFQWLKHFFFKGNCLCHPSVLIRKHCYDRIGLYDERFAQLPDFDFWIRLCTRYEIYIMPEKLVRFRVLQEKTNVSANTPKNVSRHFLEYAQILKNYLNPEILENLVQIFDITPRVDQIGISMKLGEVESDTAPFFLAMLAQQANYPAHKYFSFDVLYQIYSNKDLNHKLRKQYSFDFSNLVNLAWEQDIFGIVALDQSQSQFHQTQAELEQSQSQLHQTQAELEESHLELHQTQGELKQSHLELHQTQGELKRSQSQLHQTQEELEQSQSQLHQTQEELEQSQSQLHQTQEVLEQSQSQLHQTQEVLEQSQSHLHQTQGEWEQSQSQLHQTQGELEQSQFQLHQTQGELEQSQSQLHQTQEELEQSQSQLHQTQEEWEQSQSQLHQTQEEWEQSQSQLHQTQGELEQSQSQLHQTQEELEQSQFQLHQTQGELEQSQSQLHQTQGELEQSQFQLHQTQGELEQSQSQLHQTQGELERSQFQQTVASDIDGQSQMQYKLLEWEAWYAYHNGDLTKMRECLQQSLKYTPLSPTETVLKWLESFTRFSSEKGYAFDSNSLTSSEDWKQLIRRLMSIKIALYKSRA